MVDGNPQRLSVPAEDPALRPHRRRRAVRVVLLDPDNRVLLLQDSDPGLPQFRWWVVPGGGVDSGESQAETAVREIAEETGFRLSADDLIGPVAVRNVIHGYSDQVLEQREVFFLARTPHFTVDISAHTVDEQLTLQGSRWWELGELAETTAWIWPGRLLDLVRLEFDRAAWPLDLGQEEESTLPVRASE